MLCQCCAGKSKKAINSSRSFCKNNVAFGDFRYRTRKSWSCERRVIGKAEHLAKGENPRFAVTSLATTTHDARALYEDLYCARGDMENRIKEQQLALFADRTSSYEMRCNQLRLYFSSFAYVLDQHCSQRRFLRLNNQRRDCFARCSKKP